MPSTRENVAVGKDTGIVAGDYEVGMGCHLAKLFITAYGGHYLRRQDAMSVLLALKEDYRMGNGLNKLSSEVMELLESGNNHGEYGMSSLLEKMAIDGYAMLDKYKKPKCRDDKPQKCWRCC